MQPINDGPRAGVSSDAISLMLAGDDVVEVGYGCEWLNNNLVLVEDISDHMLPGSTVSSDVYSTIHRSCSLVFDSDVPFNYASDFVKPYMTLTNPDTGVTARFNLGVYSLETPEFGLAALPSAMTFSGLDLLHFLDQPVGDAYELPVGSDPAVVAAGLIASVVPGAIVAFTPSGKSTTSVYNWPFTGSETTTYLAIVNDLLSMVGYLGVWVDWDGTFQIGPYVNPGLGSAEWFFDLGASNNIVAEERTAAQSFYDVPNWWRFVMQNLSASPVEGTTMLTYVDLDPQNPGSYPNRGRYVKRVQAVDVVDYASLKAFASVSIAADLSPAETFHVKTSPFPLAWHRDLFSYEDPNLASVPPLLQSHRRVLARSWELALDGSSDMTWVWETVTPTTVT